MDGNARPGDALRSPRSWAFTPATSFCSRATRRTSVISRTSPRGSGGGTRADPTSRTLRSYSSTRATKASALERAKHHAGAAYRGFFDPTDEPAELRRSQKETAAYFLSRGEPGAAEIVLNMLDGDWLVANDLVLIGSPETVSRKLARWAEEGMFNTFFGEFNFGQLPEDDLLRSIRLFGTEVIPRLRDYEPFWKQKAIPR